MVSLRQCMGRYLKFAEFALVFMLATVVARHEKVGAHIHRIVVFKDSQGHRIQMENPIIWKQFQLGCKARLWYGEYGWITDVELISCPRDKNSKPLMPKEN